MKSSFIEPYLFFAGQCEAAIDFYRKGLGAHVDMMMRFNEAPQSAPPGALQDGFENKIMHASIRIGSSTLMMSDGCSDKSHFDGFRLSLSLPDEAEAKRAFAVLSEGGSVQMPLGKTFWSPCFGMVTDRFGVGWMIGLAANATA